MPQLKTTHSLFQGVSADAVSGQYLIPSREKFPANLGDTDNDSADRDPFRTYICLFLPHLHQHAQCQRTAWRRYPPHCLS